MSTGSARYTAQDIEVIEGLEAVRRRPSMYIGGVDSRGLHHLLWEIVDNSVDEHLAGHCNEIIVTLHKDGASCSVQDNGRAIPIDLHQKTKKSALEKRHSDLSNAERTTPHGHQLHHGRRKNPGEVRPR